MLYVGVYVEMVGVHGRYHGDFRMQLQERPVEFVSFGDDYVVVPDKQVRIIVLRYPSQEGGASFTAGAEYVGKECARGGLAVRTCHRQAPLARGDLPEDTRALDHLVAVLSHILQFLHVMGYGRSVYDHCASGVLRDEVRIVLIVDGYPFAFELAGQFGRCAVIP